MHEEAIRLGLNCLYMTDLSLKQSLYKQEFYCALQVRCQ